MTRSRTALALAGLATLGATALPAPAHAAARPDTECMQNGIAWLKDNGLFSAVAQGGLPISAAVANGVAVRPGADISGVPDPIPLSVVLADHRAGSNSLFTYTWCPGR